MPTILYAEDDPDQHLLVRISLKGHEFRLIEARDGQEALTKIKSAPPDLILLDLFMPFMDGFGVMKAVKADPHTEHIPIVVLSAWPTGDNRMRARKNGADDFLAKPYNPAHLVRVIKKHLPAKESSRPLPG